MDRIGSIREAPTPDSVAQPIPQGNWPAGSCGPMTRLSETRSSGPLPGGSGLCAIHIAQHNSLNTIDHVQHPSLGAASGVHPQLTVRQHRAQLPAAGPAPPAWGSAGCPHLGGNPGATLKSQGAGSVPTGSEPSGRAPQPGVVAGAAAGSTASGELHRPSSYAHRHTRSLRPLMWCLALGTPRPAGRSRYHPTPRPDAGSRSPWLLPIPASWRITSAPAR